MIRWTGLAPWEFEVEGHLGEHELDLDQPLRRLPTNPRRQLKSTFSAVRFMAKNIRTPSVFSLESQSKKHRFEPAVRVGGQRERVVY